MKKQFKTLIVLFVAVAMIFAFTSCAEKPTEKAEEIVTKAFEALQSGDIENASKYTNIDNLVKDADLDFSERDLEKDQKLVRAIMKAFFANLNCEILSSEQQKDGTVQVEVKISNVNMKEVTAEWMSEMVEIGIKYCDLDDTSEEMDSLEWSDVIFFNLPEKAVQEVVVSLENGVKKAVKDDNFKETATSLKVKETEDGWKVDLDEEQMDIIFADFTKALNQL